MASGSKNNLANKGTKMIGSFKLESDCRECKNQCTKGLEYVRAYSIKKQGNGIWCSQK